MTETNTQISVYDALLKDNPTILSDVRNVTSRLITLSHEYTNQRAMLDYLRAFRAFMNELGFPDSDFVFLSMPEKKLDELFGTRNAGSLLDPLPEATRQRVTAGLDALDATGELIADYYPQCTYSLALADLAARLNRATR